MKITDGILSRVGRLVAEDNAALGLVIHTRYEVVCRIARGGMGEVCFARDRRLGRPVAMKILSPALSGPEWRARFEREVQTMTRIDHPGVVPIYDVGDLPDGRLYYTMKLVEGLTLAERLADGAASGEERRKLLGLLVQACRIVQYAHERGVIHRDLKPGNIMIGKQGEVYILDWGVARVREEYLEVWGGDGAAAGEGLTSAGSILGTLEYMAPEQAAGDPAAIDARSDVYALGAVLYHVLAGRPRVVGGGPATEMLQAVVRGEVEPPRRRNRAIPADLEAICLKALAKARARRYASAGELGEDLERYLGGEPVRAYPGGFGYRWGKLLRRRRGTSWAAAVLVMGTLGGWAWKRAQARDWIQEARARAAAGEYEEAKRLLDQAVGWVAVDPELYGRCERALLEHRARSEEKRREDEIFGPIRARLEGLPATAEGWRRGLELLDKGLKSCENSWQAWMKKGEFHEKLSEYDEALSAYAHVITVNPKVGTACYRRGWILLHILESREEALREFERAVALDMDNEYAQIGQACIAYLRKDIVASLDLLRKIEATARHAGEYHYLLGCIYTSEAAGRELRDVEKGLTELSRAIKIEPAKAIYYSVRALAYQAGGDFERAMEDHNRAVEVDPRHARVYSNRAVTRMALQDFDGAISDCAKAIEIKPKYAIPYTNRALARFDKGDFQGALDDLVLAIRLNPGEALPYNNRGAIRYSRGDVEGALEDWKRALEKDPREARVYVNLSMASDRKGDVDRALEHAARAVELNPFLPDAYLARGLRRAKKGDLDAALEDIFRAAEMNPRDYRIFQNRAQIRKRMNDMKGALEDLTRAVELRPREPRLYFSRGNTRRDSRDAEGALQDFSRAVELDPMYADAYMNRGSLRNDRGDPTGALEDWKKALQVAPPNWHHRAELEEYLRSLAH